MQSAASGERATASSRLDEYEYQNGARASASDQRALKPILEKQSVPHNFCTWPHGPDDLSHLAHSSASQTICRSLQIAPRISRFAAFCAQPHGPGDLPHFAHSPTGQTICCSLRIGPPICRILRCHGPRDRPLFRMLNLRRAPRVRRFAAFCA